MSAGTFEGELATVEARMLRAELLGDEAGWRELRELYRRQEQGLRLVTPVAFAMAVVARFSGVADLREVTRFVGRYNALAQPEDQVPPREAESMLRAVLGELHLEDVVEVGLRGSIGYAMLFALVDDLGFGEKEIYELLVAAERAVLDAVQRGEVEPFPKDLADVPVVSRDTPRRRPGMRRAADMSGGSPNDATKRSL